LKFPHPYRDEVRRKEGIKDSNSFLLCLYLYYSSDLEYSSVAHVLRLGLHRVLLENGGTFKSVT
jgi:hypothetical protein